jgi:cyclic-di-GMP phosphodiesterase, flagellum assembly factor TipF
MMPGGILQLTAAVAGAVVTGGGFFLVGVPLAAASAAGLLGGVSVVSCLAAVEALRGKRAADARFDTLADEMVLLRQRQIETDARFVSVEQRMIESPALAWRAATADIEVLGSLLSDLAKTVSEHDLRLGVVAPDAVAVLPQPEKISVPERDPAADGESARPRGFVLPQTSPPPAAWFEDEFEQRFAADMAQIATPAFTVPPVPAPQTVPLQDVVAELKSTLAAALSSERLELCLQPYVMLPQRKVVGYEAALRLKGEDGELQGIDELRAVATAAGMGRDLDRILIERAGQVLRVLRARDRVVSITCAVTGDSLLDAAFRSAVEFMARGDGKLAQSILLSVPLADIGKIRSDGMQALETLRRTGVTLGVRAGHDTNLGVAALERLGVIEVRMRADALLATAHAAGGADIHPADISELLERRGMRLLVTGADSEDAVRDLLDFAATLAQGELFGNSRPVRPEVLQPRAVAEPGAGARIKSAKVAEQAQRAPRQSFRSLLRRA